MADLNGSSDSGQPNLDLTPEERRVFGQLFQAADTGDAGVLVGDVAVKFFERTKLPPSVLGEIWQIADTQNRGLLTPAGFGIAMRLIGHYQAGRDPTPELGFQPGPLPNFDGLTGSANGQSNAPSSPAPMLQSQASGGPVRVPPLTPDKVNEYSALFDKSGATNGILAGETAKSIFERARLPNEVLGRIWTLADTEQRGALGVTEFIIAMHLLASYKSGALRGLPQILPPALYDAASRRVAGSRPSTSSGVPRGTSPGGAPPVPAIPRQFSGTGPPRTQSPLSRAPYSTPPPTASPTSNDWAVSPQEKAHFDTLYATLDKANQGYINGDQAVGFFGNSRLPEEVLAQIWDLADINSEGRLNRDQFAVAMYLIKQQRGKRDGRGALPSTLPPNLIPPSMRQQSRPPPQPTAPTFDNAANATQSRSAADDLFGLDAFSSPAPAQAPQSTGGSSYSRPFESSPTSPQLGQGPSQNQSSVFKPFVPSSSFGQNMMTSQATGGSNASGPGPNRGIQPSQPSAMDDLLGDNDPEISKKLTQETTELANLSNQVGSLSKQMQEVKSKRSTTENELSNASSQKRDFELRLSQLRTMYEQEVKDVKSLEDRLATSRNEMRRLQQEMAMIEGTHQDLQNQHQQVAGALEADQLENSNLKEKMRQVNAEINELKPQLEKLRSDARKQKGLVAINKKQLATNEGERERLKSEVDEQARSNEEASRSMQSTPYVRSPAAMASPPASTPGQSTNPFFRRSATASSENATSPQPLARDAAPAQQQASFESVFGPSFTSSPQTTGPPPTSFRRESQSRDIPTNSAQSGPSVRSSEGPDVQTPSTSPPPSLFHDSPRSVEPPAPPESRQITSSFLPMRSNPERADSLSSSVKVSAPASRVGGNDFSGVETPTNYTDSYAPTPTHEQNVRKGLERTDTNTTETGSGAAPSSLLDRNMVSPPPANKAQKLEPKTTDQDDAYGFGQPLEQRGSIPGAFPETPGVFGREPSASVQPRSSGEGALSDRNKTSSSLSEGLQSTRPDPFSLGTELTRGPAAAKDDFDAAFAGIGDSRQPSERQKTGGSSTEGSVGTGSTGANKFHKEFPPIEEFGHDDESDSSSERGFDDNFTSASPQQPHSNVARHQAQLSSSSRAESGFGEVIKDPATLRPKAPQFQSSASGQLPTASAQQSPPTYDQTISPSTGSPGAHRDSNQFPAEYNGLLPSRQDPTSPASPHGSNSPEKSFTSPATGGQALFGGSNASKIASSSAPTAFSSSPPHSNTPLSTAPSDAYQSAVQHPSGGKGPALPAASHASQASHTAKGAFDDDFDREFGDLADAEEANEQGDDDFGVSHHHQEGFDEFNPVFDSPKPNNVTHPQNAGGSHSHGDDVFNDFEHNIGGSTHAQPRTNPPPEISANSQDWDAIFAGLDSVHADIPGGDRADFSQPNIPPKEQLSPVANSHQNQEPSSFQPLPNRGGNEDVASSSASKAPDLPQLGRALSGGTEHDDPILKRLTGMGYPRDDSLNALERFDYNIDKAADFLTSK
ncbi:MAG: hypothetical protein M1812_005071 [Candelaria pacifica]|nr:MAG: hypothetical protein M1812_005071 [Candelaria pacifica]